MINEEQSSKIDISDIEAFINGLKASFDCLESLNHKDLSGFQAKMAKAISSLRQKKVAIAELTPRYMGHLTKEDTKSFFLKELELLTNVLDEEDHNRTKKFRLVMEIAKLRERIYSF